MAQPDDTTIPIKKKTRQRLEEAKIHPRQSYDELLNDMLDKAASHS